MNHYGIPIAAALTLLFVGCIESNPQPSPHTGKDTWSVADTRAEVGPGIGDVVGPADGAAVWDHAAEDAVADGVGDGCPERHPWLARGEWSLWPWSPGCELPEGTVCSWPAEGCEPGAKPDNVCTCLSKPGGGKRFECVLPVHNCLPLSESDSPYPVLGPAGEILRPRPANRAAGEVCASTLEPRGEACVHSRAPAAGAEDTCATDADCEGEGARCLDSYPLEAWTDGGTLCQCYVPACLDDSGCEEGTLCRCGVTANGEGTPCGGYFGKPCLHQCIPAGCRTDADCGDGGFCSPSRDGCGWQIEGYHCHHPDAAECFSDWECMGAQCRHEDGDGWICDWPLLCD